jgi:hypothetical protein
LFDDGNINPASAASANPCEVFIYIGSKQASGNEIERAGLTNGKFYGVRVSRGSTILTAESNDFGFGDAGTGFIGTASFDLVELDRPAMYPILPAYRSHRPPSTTRSSRCSR